MESTSKKKSCTVANKGKGKASKEPAAETGKSKSKEKQAEEKKIQEEKKKEKVQKKKALDERDFNILGQLSLLNKSVVVIDEQGRDMEEKEKDLERKKEELEQREREVQRKEGNRNKENEVVFSNLERIVAGPFRDESYEDDENEMDDFGKYRLYVL